VALVTIFPAELFMLEVSWFVKLVAALPAIPDKLVIGEEIPDEGATDWVADGPASSAAPSSPPAPASVDSPDSPDSCGGTSVSSSVMVIFSLGFILFLRDP
jgi:hypothetical protein